MATQIKTDSLDQWHQYGVYTPARLIDLSGEICEETAVQFIKNIRLLDHVTEKDIKILINTEGGDVAQGMAIIDAIKECQSKVITHAVGPAHSMGAVILQAGDKRLISANATLMIHIGKAEVPEDHTHNVDRWYKECKRLGKIADDILFDKIKKKKPRFQRKKFEEIITFDTIYSAEKAIEMGLADRIVEHKSF